MDVRAEYNLSAPVCLWSEEKKPSFSDATADAFGRIISRHHLRFVTFKNSVSGHPSERLRFSFGEFSDDTGTVDEVLP